MVYYLVGVVGPPWMMGGPHVVGVPMVVVVGVGQTVMVGGVRGVEDWVETLWGMVVSPDPWTAGGVGVPGVHLELVRRGEV